MNKKRLVLILVNLVLLAVSFPLILWSESILPTNAALSPYLSLGFVMISAYLMGLAVKEFGLPALTGYLAAGMLFGPYCLGDLSTADIESLELINAIALSFIAITAGGELRLSSLKANGRTIGMITGSHTIFMLVGTMVTLPVILRLFPVQGISGTAILMISLLMTTIAIANSPATTIAVINEFKARGPFTDVSIGVTMVKDIIVLLLFAMAMAVCQGMDAQVPVSMGFLGHLLAEIVISIGAGVMFGALMILFYRFVAREVSVFIVLASLAAHELALVVGLEHMLMCMVAGFVVQNYSARGPLMIEGIERSQLPIYVVFFSIAGAGLNFSYMGVAFAAVMMFLVVRTALVFGSTWVGAKLGGGSDVMRRFGWTGFLTNAGLSLSIVIVVEQTFPDWGGAFKAIAISVIAINQIIGPILFKIGLTRSGESRA